MKIFKFQTERTCFLLEYKPLRENTYHERKKINQIVWNVFDMNAIMKSQKILCPQFYPPEPPSRPPPPYTPINLHSTAIMKKRGLLHKQKLHNYTPINYRDSVFKILKRCCNNTISLRIMMRCRSEKLLLLR